jgi:hypothetical protein
MPVTSGLPNLSTQSEELIVSQRLNWLSGSGPEETEQVGGVSLTFIDDVELRRGSWKQDGNWFCVKNNAVSRGIQGSAKHRDCGCERPSVVFHDLENIDLDPARYCTRCFEVALNENKEEKGRVLVNYEYGKQEPPWLWSRKNNRAGIECDEL